MADVKINMMLNDSGNTIQKRTTETKALNTELTKTQRLAQGVSMSGGGGGGRPSMTSGEVADYGRSRAVGTGTGASARDFANQAQGLGGLVRLYATYAANVFAVSAAFTALRNAANVDNLIKSLDQLGVRSGISLGSVAKSFSDATGGAISLQEAAQATTKAVSAGLSADQFQKLGEVAKKASQALGVDLSDAVSRLTRGITKLEPELLDELGIYTKLEPAVEAYARAVGKSASSLTDFERRQAFAIAVLEEGNSKFKDIQAITNPYDKLLATLKDVSVQILNLFNNVIGPVVSLFANNMALVVGAIGLAAAKIVSQALPALAKWGIGLKQAADSALKNARAVEGSFGDAFVERVRARENLPKLKQEFETLTREYNTAVQKFKSDTPLQGLTATTRMRFGEELSKSQVRKIEKEILSLQKDGNLETQKHAALLTNILDINRRRLAVGIDLEASEERAFKKADRNRVLSEAWQRETIVRSAKSKAASLDLLSGVSKSISEKGFFSGLGEFYSQTAASKDLTRFDKLKTTITGTFIGGVRAAGIFFSSISRFIPVIGQAIFAFEILDMLFSTNAKELQNFNSAIDQSNSSIQTAISTIGTYRDEALSIEGLTAYKNALDGIVSSLDKTSISYENLIRNSSDFDVVLDKIKGFFGFGADDKQAEAIKTSILNSLELIADPQIKARTQKNLAELLNIPEVTKKSLENLDEDLANFGSGVSKILRQSRLEVTSSLAPLVEAQESVKKLETAYSDFFVSLTRGGSAQDKVYSAQFKALYDINILLEQNKGTFAAFVNTISSNEELLKVLPESIQNSINALPGLEKELQVLRLELQALQKDAKKYKDEIAGKEGLIKGYELSIKFITDTIKNTVTETSKKLLSSIDSSARRAADQADISLRKSILSLYIKTPETVKEQIRLEQRSIDIRIEEIDALNRLATELKINSVSTKLLGDTNRLAEEERKPQGERNQELISSLKRGITSGETTLDFLQGKDITGRLITPEILEEQIRQREQRAQRAALIQQREGVAVRGRIEIERERQDQIARRAQERRQLGETQSQAATITPEFAALTSAEQIRRRSMLETEKETNQYYAKKEALQNRINELTGKQDEASVSIKSELLAQLDATNSQYEATKILRDRTTEREIALENINIKSQEELQLLQNKLALSDMQSSYAIEKLDLDQKSLQLMFDQGIISQDQLNSENRKLELLKLELQTRQKIASVQSGLAQKLAQIDRDIEKATVGGSATEVQNLNQQRTLAIQLAVQEISIIDKTGQAYKDLLNSTENLTDRQKAYESIIISGADRMADAWVKFAETGKMSFKGMINSMLEDLLRYEARQAYLQAWSGVRQPVLDWIGQLFGGSSWTGPGFGDSVTGVSAGAPGVFVSAKGSYFSGSSSDFASGAMQKFAKGGMFTNSIVDNPTIFKFAKGVGMMGEAGPEAIMPLKRDNSGNLGVRAQGSKTEVIVNNYGDQKASAEETVDSRGNRKIEVTIGDMTAGEISRPGSATNRSIKSTFGVKPQLIRR